MKRLLKYVTFVCFMIMSIFAVKKPLDVSNNDEVKSSEQDIISRMKISNAWSS